MSELPGAEHPVWTLGDHGRWLPPRGKIPMDDALPMSKVGTFIQEQLDKHPAACHWPIENETCPVGTTNAGLEILSDAMRWHDAWKDYVKLAEADESGDTTGYVHEMCQYSNEMFAVAIDEMRNTL